MGAPDLIIELRKAGCSIHADGEYLDISPAENVPSDMLQQLKQHKRQILAALRLEQQIEARRKKVLAMLAANLGIQRAVHVDIDSDPDNAILAVAIRDVATFEMKVLKKNYDQWQLLTLVENAEAGDLH